MDWRSAVWSSGGQDDNYSGMMPIIFEILFWRGNGHQLTCWKVTLTRPTLRSELKLFSKTSAWRFSWFGAHDSQASVTRRVTGFAFAPQLCRSGSCEEHMIIVIGATLRSVWLRSELPILGGNFCCFQWQDGIGIGILQQTPTAIVWSFKSRLFTLSKHSPPNSGTFLTINLYLHSPKLNLLPINMRTSYYPQNCTLCQAI